MFCLFVCFFKKSSITVSIYVFVTELFRWLLSCFNFGDFHESRIFSIYFRFCNLMDSMFVKHSFVIF